MHGYISVYHRTTMDIRQATVSHPALSGHSHGSASIIEAEAQVDDLLGMQNANLLNLPENYTFKYCQ